MIRTSHVLVPLALLTLLGGSGCAEDQELFIIQAALAPDDECAYTGDTTLLIDTIDVSLNAPFGLALLLENLQTGNGGSNTGLVDDGELKIEYAEVRLTLTDGTAPAGLDTSFEVPLASGSLKSGETLAVFVQVPASVAGSLSGSIPVGTLTTLEMGVVIVADRTAQVANGHLGEVRSREFVFPYTVCNGCLASCSQTCGLATASNCSPPEADPDTTDTGTTGP